MSDTDDLAISAPLIQHYEECILHPYPDANGIPTIGWGNTIYRNGDRVTLQDPPLAQADADIKGAASDPIYALERTVISISRGLSRSREVKQAKERV